MRIIENNPPASPKVSVLTPVCNTSKFLRECLDSLVSQSLRDIEFICLNDGSTDESLDILLEYQKRDNRIRVVDKPNSGYGATMNLGISLAKGEYIGILESDDFAEKSMFSRMYRFAKWHDCDMMKCSYYNYSADGNVKVRPYDQHRYRKVLDPREDVTLLFEIPSIWAALYRRSMILDNEVRFNETPGASYQDTSFVFQCWACARRVALLPDCLLHYRVDNAGSSVASSKKVFAVCDEYALSQEFLDRDPERKRAFGSALHVIKFGTYKWNYNRIDAESKIAFAQRMAEEFRVARAAGELDETLFSSENWEFVQAFMADPDAATRAYPELP